MMHRPAAMAIVLLMPCFAAAVDDPHAHHRHTMESDGSPILVTINPEARVSVRMAAALPAPAACGSALDIPVRIVNQGYVTAPLQVYWLGEPPPGATLALDGGPLSGAAEELRTLRVTLTNRGPSDLTIGFRTRNNTPDLGGRDRVHFLLDCLPTASVEEPKATRAHVLDEARKDDGHPLHVSGHAVFTGTTENCQSPLGQCAIGAYEGGLRGHSFNTALKTVPSQPDGMFFFQEDEVIHVADGDITTQVSAAAHFVPDGEIASIHRIVGGTGVYAGATGFLLFTGAADETGLGATLQYSGEIHLQ